MSAGRKALALIPAGPRAHLPSLWDGRPVIWREALNPCQVTHIGDLPCAGCGSTDAETDSHMGRVEPAPGATFTGPVKRRLRSGRAYYRNEEQPERSTWKLFLTRCLCGHDEVYDVETEEIWVLDDADFGPKGSWNNEPTLPGLA